MRARTVRSFYVAMYWAEAVAAQDPSYAELAKNLADNEQTILGELIDCQGSPVDIGGYYHPDAAKVEEAMRPSKTFNAFIDSV